MKDRQIPNAILIIEALLRRLDSEHNARDKLNKELRRSYAGFLGEQSIDFHLKFINRNTNRFFHGLRLPWKEGIYFQIDTLILSPQLIILLEVKNIAGELFFDHTAQQLIRKSNEIEEAFQYPITQVNRHVHQLNSWLRNHGFQNIPIVPFVIISSSSSILKTDPESKEIFKMVTHAPNIPQRINSLGNHYTHSILSPSQIEEISDLLLQEHTVGFPNILKKYNITKELIQSGVACEKCLQLSLKRNRGYWSCVYCDYVSKRAHTKALMDYLLLIDSTITNSQFRNFLHLSSASISSKLLRALPLQTMGTFKNRKYLLDQATLENYL